MFWRTEDHPAPHQRPTRSKPGRRSPKGSPRRFLAQPVYPFCDYMSRQRCAYGPGHSDRLHLTAKLVSTPTPLRALRSWRELHVNAENTDAANGCAVRDVPELLGYGTAGRHSHHDYVAVFHLQAVRLRMARAVHLHVARPSKRNALTTRVSRCAAAPSGVGGNRGVVNRVDPLSIMSRIACAQWIPITPRASAASTGCG